MNFFFLPQTHVCPFLFVLVFLGIAFCLSVCRLWQKFRLEKIHISKSIQPRIMKFCQDMNVNDPKVDIKGQGQGHQVQKCDLSLIGQSFESCSQSQGFPWSRSKLMWIKVNGHLAQGQLHTAHDIWEVGSHQRQVASFCFFVVVVFFCNIY